MRIPLSALVLAAATTSLCAQIEVRTDLKVDEGVIKDFHVALGVHFGVEQRAVVALCDEVSDGELPVVLHLAASAKVAPAAIVALRREKKSWMDITLHFGLSPEIFHVPVTTVPGPPYGRAYGYFKNKARSDWGEIRLSDDEIVHLVNVKFLCAHHHCSPEDVLRLQVGPGGFVELYGELKRRGHAARRAAHGRDKPRPPASSGTKRHGKGPGHGRKG